MSTSPSSYLILQRTAALRPKLGGDLVKRIIIKPLSEPWARTIAEAINPLGSNSGGVQEGNALAKAVKLTAMVKAAG